MYDADSAAEPGGSRVVGYKGPPEPVGAVRVRLVSGHGWADLRGATTCEAIIGAEAAAVVARLGPDPLRNRPGDRDTFAATVTAKRTPLAALLMDQKAIAGVGNVYRAELLFRQRLNPWLPGAGLSPDAARRLWDDTAVTMSDGVRDGRIITTPPQYWGTPSRDGQSAASRTTGRPQSLPEPDQAHFVYRRHGLDCRDCGTPVPLTELAARKLYWCPQCQQADSPES